MLSDNVARHRETSLENFLSKQFQYKIQQQLLTEGIPEHRQQVLGEAGESFRGQEDYGNLVSAKQLWSNWWWGGGGRVITTVELSEGREY